MRILPVIFLFSMMTKAQDKVVLGFLIHGVNLILNKGMTGIWIARRYWLFFYIEEPIYPLVYHVFGGGQDYFLQYTKTVLKLTINFLKPTYLSHFLTLLIFKGKKTEKKDKKIILLFSLLVRQHSQIHSLALR